MVNADEVKQTIIELKQLRDKFGYDSMPIKGIITMLNWLLRDDPEGDISMLRGILGTDNRNDIH